MKNTIRVKYGHPSEFSDRDGPITPSQAYQRYRDGAAFNVNFGTTFVPPEIMSQILEFTSHDLVRKATVQAMTSGDAKELSRLLQMYHYVVKMPPIALEDFNDRGGENVMIEQPDHPRKAYTVLEWCTTLRYQLEHWRDNWYRYHLRTEMGHTTAKEEQLKLGNAIRDWSDLERELFMKESLEQRKKYEERQGLIENWDRTEGTHGRLPAGYFIMLNLIFDWIPPAYSDLVEGDKDLYVLPDEDETSLYSLHPLREV